MRGASFAVGLAATLVVASTLLPPAGSALPAGLMAQEPGIVTTLDTTTITVGDRLTFDATVGHAPDATVLWPDTLDLAPFEVLEVDTLPSRRSGEQERSGLRVLLTAFELGTLEIPPLMARIVSAEGDTATVTSDRWRVEVVSVGLDEEGGIREIRGPRSIPVGVRSLLPWLAGALALGLLAWWWLRRGRPDAGAPSGSAEPRPPHEVALEALAALEATDLPARGEIKRFHVEVSEIVRAYLESRYGVPALETTTGELLAVLAHPHGPAEVAADVRTDLRRFLERCDLVKFAKYEPSAEASRELLPLARSVVERTRPAPSPQDASGSDATEGDAPEEDTSGEDAPGADASRTGSAEPRPSGAASAGVDATRGGAS